MDQSADVAVVGAGLAGLAAATLLAGQGRSVVVLERSGQIGGRSRTREKGGFHFNVGPHALYRGGAAHAVLRDLGVSFRGQSPDGRRALGVTDDAVHPLPASVGSLLSSRLLGLGAKWELARLLQRLPRIESARHDGMSLRAWIETTIRHRPVADLLLAFFRISSYANDPARTSAGAAIAQLQAALRHGVLYLDGGWQTLVDGLAERARAAGVRIVTGADVAAIEHDGRVRGVRLRDGARWSASYVVSTLPAPAVAALPGLEGTELARQAATRVPVRAATLDLGLRRLPRPLAQVALGLSRPVYLSVHSAVARLAPVDGALIHAAYYIGPDSPAPAAMEAELEALVDRVQPGWRGEVVERRFVPDLLVTNALPLAVEGGQAGRPHRRGRHPGAVRGRRLDRTRRPAGGREPRQRARGRGSDRGPLRPSGRGVNGGASSGMCHHAPVQRAAIEEAFRAHRGYLWSLGYRMLGNAADADEVVQETFVRALTHPPADTARAWRPWLTRVAMNLGRDLLRRRRRRHYEGPWLPAPVPTDRNGLPGEPVDPAPGPHARYDRLESVTFAFLLALEALSPGQRAVLILRDVFDYSVRETADALQMSEANVKTTHLRARRVMEGYDTRRGARGGVDARRSQQALERFLSSLAQGDAAGLEAVLAQDVVSTSDGGGEFAASRRRLHGSGPVAHLYLGLTQKAGRVAGLRWLTLNGQPGVEVTFAGGPAGWAPRAVLQVDTDDEGRIAHVYSVMATCKLTAVGASDGASAD